MSEENHPLLVTKLFSPRWRANSVSRPRLLEVLDHGLDTPLILVAAAAGSGKTTLITEWTNQYKERSCWLALDSGDNDPIRFFTYLLGAIQTVDQTVGQELMPALRASTITALDSIVDALLNELFTLTERVIIALDDYHVIEREQIHQGLTRLLTHLPTQVSLVLLTRSDPLLPLARMRAHGELVEVRAEHLRFTQAEADYFFNDAQQLGLSATEVSALGARTEGWAAGLQLAALAMQSYDHDRTAFIQNFTGSNRHILDYLMEEVLQGQTEDVRQFMLQTSVLSRFNGPLCNLVTHRTDSAQVLDYLDRNNLFLIPLDDSRQWFRHHHLFAELLQAQLDEQEPESTRQIQKIAAAWHKDEGDHELAIDYALKAGEFNFAAELIQARLSSAMWQTALSTWQRWVHLLPMDALAEHPFLAMAFGQSLAVSGRIRESIALWQQVNPEHLPLQAALMREYLNVDSEHTMADFVEIAVEARTQPLGQVEQIMLAFVLSNSGDYRAACDAVDEADALSTQAGDAFTAWMALIHRCRLYNLLGDLHHANKLGQGAVVAAESVPPALLDLLGIVYMVLGYVHLAWNQLDEAERYARLALQNVEETGFVMSVLTSATMLLAETTQAQGDRETALIEAKRALELARQVDFPFESDWLQIHMVQIQLRLGDLDAANAWLAQRTDLPPSRFYLQRSGRITEAQIALANGQNGKAIAQLTKLTAEPSDLLTAETWLLLALARQASGDEQHALIALTTAISTAEAQNNVRSFLNQAAMHGPSLAKLLDRFDQEQPENAFAAHIRAQLSAAPATPPQPTGLLEPLGERELEVLRLIVAGHSNKEIAAELILALNTVKWYIKELYSKMHVKSRGQAIARAHELNLFQ